MINFTTASCSAKQPESVYKFYATSCSQPLVGDLSCCNTHIPCSQDVANCDIDEGNVGEYDNGDDDFLFNQQDLDDIDESFEKVSEETMTLPNDFDLSTFVQSLKYEDVNTDFQSVVNYHLDSLFTNDINALERFMCKHWVMVDDILSGKPSTAHAGHSQMYFHTVSPEYKCKCEQLFKTPRANITAEQWHVAFLLCSGVREVVVQRVADDITTSRPSVNGK